MPLGNINLNPLGLNAQVCRKLRPRTFANRRELVSREQAQSKWCGSEGLPTSGIAGAGEKASLSVEEGQVVRLGGEKEPGGAGKRGGLYCDVAKGGVPEAEACGADDVFGRMRKLSVECELHGRLPRIVAARTTAIIVELGVGIAG